MFSRGPGLERSQLHSLSVKETLALFGDHYRTDVLKKPDGTDHGNIRMFMKQGWSGITFDRFPLKEKNN
ncbi:HopJ type III effector protein [Endozoicomonas montiporae]|uniref:HopJ type III effector protein n=1 Tax=Endozoicomonas montiporae TaxID=1027273 RepID=UPI000777C2BB|nr:HopJ type III effector protein [Endozoicomonas montiporae]